MNRFKTIFSVASESHVKKLLTFRRWQCLTTASAISCFFNDVQFICNDLASILSSAAGRQSTASCTVLSSESCKKTQNIDDCHSHSGFIQNSDCGFPDFSRTKLLFFLTFRGTLFIFMWTKNITKLAFKRWNFLYNVFFYSKYRMGL